MNNAMTGVIARSAVPIGRNEDLARIETLLRTGARLVTLRGPGGIGKTTLAAHLARTSSDAYDHVLFVDLTAERDPRKVLDVVAAHLPDTESRADALQRLAAFAAERRALLILDNFEQVVEAAEDVVRLLDATTTLQVLVTSRVVLHVHAEHEVNVEPLTLPDVSKSGTDGSAVQLFAQRARQVNAIFELNDATRPLVADLVTRLEGVPLAIELAASRLRTFTLPDLLARLDHPLQVLKADFRDRPERLRSLRAAVKWSYDLLATEDREVFECCAVFEGSFTPEALVAVWGGEDVLDRVEHLIEQSFLQRAEGPETRWKMLQPLRELALEQLHEQAHARTWRERHARYYLAVAERSQPAHPGPPSDLRERYLPDYANMRAGLVWAIEHLQAEMALRYLPGMSFIWVAFAFTSEGVVLTERVLELPAPGLRHLRPRALHVMLDCLIPHERHDAFTKYAHELVEVSRAEGNAAGELNGSLALAIGEYRSGRNSEALRMNQQLIRRCQEFLDAPRDQQPTTLTEAKLRNILGNAYNNATLNLVELGAHEPALEYARKAVEQYRQAGRSDVLIKGDIVGLVQYHLGRYEAAAEAYRASFDAAVELGAWRSARSSLVGVCLVAAATGDDALAVRVLAFAARLHHEPLGRYTEGLVKRAEGDLRERLGDAEYQKVWREGEQWTLDEARVAVTTYVTLLREKGISANRTPPRRSDRSDAAHDLTARERDVLALVAQGHPDRRIAKLLGISPTTASKHVSNMLSKLGLRNRTELAAWAAEHHLRK